MLEGGCLCGALRYVLDRVVDAGFCHCTTCRRGSGSAFAVWAAAAPGAFRVVRGEPQRYAVEPDETRAFCGTCGTPVWVEGARGLRIHVGTLDDAAAVAPRLHLVAHEQLPWLKLGDLLPWTEEREPLPEAERVIWRKPADPAVTRESPLSLRAIDKENLRPVLLLDVKGHQRRMVAGNGHSLAQHAHEPRSWARAITAGETVVGFTLLDRVEGELEGMPADGDPYLWRFMIDERYQRLGFGRRALELVVATAREALPAARTFWLTCVPSRVGPYEFYRRCGFEDTGRMDPDGEVILRRAYA